MPRFVILLHEMPANCSRATHYDLMLEHGPMLRTWALERIPGVGETVSAQRLDDHRPVYLDYEGDISADRGQVRRVDQGDYEMIEDRPERLVVKIGGTHPGIVTLALDQPAHRWRVSLSGA
jgi:hypothetical protein